MAKNEKKKKDFVFLKDYDFSIFAENLQCNRERPM